MPFKLINASATFQRFIIQILDEVLKRGVLIYLNDILIAHRDKEEHKRYIKRVKKLLTEAELIIKEKKSKYFKKKMKFLRFILSEKRINKNLYKIRVIKN